ncbi:MAG: beta-ketoacyl synthase chain length factor, partial [Azonexus sp.]|nr:beta-ketoacyl synthase chain length factor [Azonexus sp.]
MKANPITPLTAWIEGVGCIAPGLPDWPSTRAVLRGELALTAAASILPVPSILPPAERRRASRVVKLALALGLEAATQANADVSTLATVFSASGADGHNCHALCEQLASADRQISPTRFHNSVHNAAAGYWGIATKSMAPCQVICAYDASFGAGLLDALSQVVIDQQITLLISYDSEYPEPLHSKRQLPDCGGVALLLTPEKTSRSLARISVSPTTANADS